MRVSKVENEAHWQKYAVMRQNLETHVEHLQHWVFQLSWAALRLQQMAFLFSSLGRV
jgi:hypothetical protein